MSALRPALLHPAAQKPRYREDVPRYVEELGPPVLSPEDAAFRAAMAQLVDWYRLRQSRALCRAFLPAAALLALGNVILAFSIARNSGVAEALRPLLAMGGLGVTALGPLWAAWQLFRALRGDQYVAIRVDGLAVRLDPQREEVLYPWEQVQRVSLDQAPGQQGVRIEIDSGEALLMQGPFAEVSLDELARRIRDARRLAVWNRLAPRFPVESP